MWKIKNSVQKNQAELQIIRVNYFNKILNTKQYTKLFCTPVANK